MKILNNELMNIFLFNNWRDIYKPKQAKIYLIGQQDREIIDKKFDIYHAQDRIK